jgi:hypothetical protein
MTGGQRQRFCDSCQRTVHDLSVLTRKQAERLVDASRDGLCARIAHDDSGQIVFRPEPETGLGRLIRISLLGISACGAQVAAAQSSASSCTVEVRVADPVNSPVAGAHVTLSRPDDPVPAHQGTTDSSGLFSDHLPAGAYQLQIDAPGFYTYARDVELACGQPAPQPVDVQLRVGVTMGQLIELRPPSSNPFVRAWYRTAGLFWRLRHSI